MHFLYDEDGALVGFNNETKTYIYTRNAQGDIISITDTSNGNTVAQYTYDSWGNVLTATGVMAEVNPFRYRGYYYDSETGLYALQSRYYDPQTGRFLNLDDFDTLAVTPEELTDKNLYAYCDNNPIMRVDRGGEFWGAIARFVGGVVAQYVGDVIGNVIEGKTGWDILKPTSSVGDYLAAGVTALIPGTGIGSALGRSVVTEGIKCVEESLNGENFDLGKSALRIAKNTAMDKAASWVSDKASKAIDAKMPRNYSSYAGVQYKKYPGITKAQIQAKIRKLDSLKNFSNGAVSFSMDILLNSLPF